MPMMKFSRLLDFTALAIRPGEPADDGQELQVGADQRLYGLYVDGRQIFLSSDPMSGLAPELLLVLPATEPTNIPLACIPSHTGVDSVLTAPDQLFKRLDDGNVGGSARLMCPVCNSVVCCCSDENDNDDDNDDNDDDAEARCPRCSSLTTDCVCDRCELCDNLTEDCTCERCDHCDHLVTNCTCSRCEECGDLTRECTCEEEVAEVLVEGGHGDALVTGSSAISEVLGCVTNPCAEVRLPVEKPISPNAVPAAGVTCHVCDRLVTECICT